MPQVVVHEQLSAAADGRGGMWSRNLQPYHRQIVLRKRTSGSSSAVGGMALLLVTGAQWSRDVY
jgi:hypothetical protein